VDITSDEERWALRWAMYYCSAHVSRLIMFSLRLVNMLASLKCMMLEGLTVSTKRLIVGHVLLSLKLSVKCLFLELYMIK
jgi:hypothetical protein